MTTTAQLVTDFDREMALTRRLMERIPPDKLEWKPHPKSTSMAGLGRHLAHMITWGRLALAHTTSDFGDRTAMPPTPRLDDILAAFDHNVAELRALIAGSTEEELAVTWSLTYHGQQVLSSSRAAVVQSMILHHQIHHRGQLSVYLRLIDVSLPSIYGPSADEAM